MKKIKGILVLIISMCFIAGCSCSADMSATKSVEKYLDRYRNQDQIVLNELDTYVENEELTGEQKNTYKEILKRQYRGLKYVITDEKYDGDTAFITVKVSVYDLYVVQKDAEEYLSMNTTEFYDEDGVYDKTLYLNYKLDKMKNTTDVIDYTITIKLEKHEQNWEVIQLSDADLEKIHGIYNYD